MKAFKVKDLMINVIPQRLGSGGAGMPGPDDDITDFPPTITPVIMVAKFSPQFRIVSELAVKFDQLDPEVVETVAQEAGRFAAAGMLVGLCTEDMPTCRANQIISPVASLGDGLRFQDLVEAKVLLNEAVVRISELENSRLNMARQQADKLIPKLEGALDELRKATKKES